MAVIVQPVTGTRSNRESSTLVASRSPSVASRHNLPFIVALAPQWRPLLAGFHAEGAQDGDCVVCSSHRTIWTHSAAAEVRRLLRGCRGPTARCS